MAKAIKGDEKFDIFGNATSEPTVQAGNYATCSYSEARIMWENGEFSDWVEQNGDWPIYIDGIEVSADECEDALCRNDTWDED